MHFTRSYRSIIVSAAVMLTFVSLSTVQGQENKRSTPEMSVAGLKLADRESGKAFLGLYQPRTEEDGRPKYYFYNGQGTTVMKVTALSVEDPFFATEIEVFWVNDSYQKTHYFLKSTPHFVTESGIFIGFRQHGGSLALALIVGVPNVGRSNIIGPKDVIKRKGEPDKRAVNDKETTFDYHTDDVAVGDAKYNYSAYYRFNRRELEQFIFRLEPQAKPEVAKAKE